MTITVLYVQRILNVTLQSFFLQSLANCTNFEKLVKPYNNYYIFQFKLFDENGTIYRDICFHNNNNNNNNNNDPVHITSSLHNYLRHFFSEYRTRVHSALGAVLGVDVLYKLSLSYNYRSAKLISIFR